MNREEMKQWQATRGRPPLPTLEQMIRRTHVDAAAVQEELQKISPNLSHIDRLLWNIRHTSVSVEGILRLNGVID